MESAKLPYVGIDIAKASFEVAVRMDSPGTQRRSVSVEQWSATATNDESGIASTVERLQGLRPALIVLEAMVVSIQTTRLVLFEFFARFMQAQGRAFRPLPAPPSVHQES